MDWERSCARCCFLLLTLAVVIGFGSDQTNLLRLFCNTKDVRRYYQHPSDCSSYIVCRPAEKPLVMRCHYRLKFDEETQTCNHGDQVKCKADTPEERLEEKFDDPPKITQLPKGARRREYRNKQSPRDAPSYLRHSHLFREVKPDRNRHQRKPVPVQNLSLAQKLDRIRSEMAYILPHIRLHAHDFYSNLSSMAKLHHDYHRPFRYVQSFLSNSPVGHKMSYTAYEQIQFLTDLKFRYGLSKNDMRSVIRRLGRLPDLIKQNKQKVHEDMQEGSLLTSSHICPYSEAADNDCNKHNLYRSLDGSCNNLKHPLWGRAMMPLFREVETDYDDGISEPRKRSVSGEPLKGAREVSWYTMVDKGRHSYTMTMLHMTFGQLLDHDIGRTAMTMIKNKDTGKLVNVECGKSGCSTEGPENWACTPIEIPDGDTVFSGKKKCLMFVRSQEVLKDDCSVGPREQLNQVTSFLDASFVYGSSLKEAKELRNLSNPERGQLKLTPNEDKAYKGLLPRKDHVDCRDFTKKRNCFIAGDKRVNEQIALMSVHTIFHRYHNELEERLHRLNPHWSGETLFQETRRLLGAVWQHIIYNEYLPSTLGVAMMKKFGLTLMQNGYFHGYDESVDPGAGNAFQTAAFRYGHSQITNDFHLANRKYKMTESVKFSTVFNRPSRVYENYENDYSGIDVILLGQLSQPADDSDPFFASEITNNLFSEDPPKQVGTDLPALNIQRGRDHGLPGYLRFREWCGLRTGRSFADLNDMSSYSKQQLARAYDDVGDIDIFVGGMLETPEKESLVGPTFSCMIGRQFRRLRVGDRFWYERNHPVTGFTPGQLREIRKMTLARVMCDTMDQVDTIQKYALLQPFTTAIKMYRTNQGGLYSLASLYKGDKNERRPCSELPQMDLSHWKDDDKRREKNKEREQDDNYNYLSSRPSWWDFPYAEYAWN